MSDCYSYLLKVRCPDCDETTTFVEEHSGPVPVDMDVPVTVPLCPHCGERRIAEGAEYWDIEEESEVKRIDGADRPELVTDGGVPDGAVGMTARENMPRDAVERPERDVDAVSETLRSVSEGEDVKLGIAVIVDGEQTGGTSVMEVYGVEDIPPNFERRINLLHHDGIANRLWITGIGNDGLDPWEVVSAPYDPVRGVLDSRDMAFHGWVVGAEVVEGSE